MPVSTCAAIALRGLRRAREGVGGEAVGQAVGLRRPRRRSSLNGSMIASGPNGSSFMTRASFGTLGHHRRLEEIALVADAVAAGAHLGAVLASRPRRSASIALRCGAGWRAGPSCDALLQAVADLERLGVAATNLLDELVVDASPAPGSASARRRPGRRCGTCSPPCVLAATSTSASSNTITGAWPPSSIVTRFMCWPASAASCLPTDGRAGERDLADHRMRDQVARDLRRHAVDQVDRRRPARRRRRRRGSARPARPAFPPAP